MRVRAEERVVRVNNLIPLVFRAPSDHEEGFDRAGQARRDGCGIDDDLIVLQCPSVSVSLQCRVQLRGWVAAYPVATQIRALLADGVASGNATEAITARRIANLLRVHAVPIVRVSTKDLDGWRKHKTSNIRVTTLQSVEVH